MEKAKIERINYLAKKAKTAPLTADELQEQKQLREEYVAEMPMIGAHPDKVLIVKAKDGKVEDVVAQLEAARTDMIENGLHYPMNLEKVQSAKVVSKGNYAAFLLVGSANNMSDDEEERLKFAEDEVQKAVTAFNSMFN